MGAFEVALNDLSTVAAWILCSTAWGLLALSQERHRERVWPEAGAWRSPVWARPLAFALLVVALGLCWRAQGPGFGALLWVVVLCATAMLLALTLTWRPHWLRPVARLLHALARPRTLPTTGQPLV